MPFYKLIFSNPDGQKKKAKCAAMLHFSAKSETIEYILAYLPYSANGA